MKMGILLSGILWGTFFILLGLSVILKFTLNLDIPVFRLFFASFLIFIGVKIILDGFHSDRGSRQNVVFDQGQVNATGRGREYNVIFGKGAVDLTGVEVGDKDIILDVNTVFGGSVVKIRPDIPTLVKANAAFGGVHLPDGNTAAFGAYVYRNKAYREGKPCLTLRANAVFGGLEVVEEVR